jgi:hypothetical protein
MPESRFLRAAFWVLVLSCAPAALAQAPRHTISGYVFDAGSGEALIGATVSDTASGRGAATDRYGRFSLLLESGPTDLCLSYLGYAETHVRFVVQGDTLLRLAMTATPLDLDAINVSASRSGVSPTALNSVRLSPEEVERVPAMGGETDLVKVLQLMPGVQGGREGSSGLYVRGGSPDQNLVLLDGTPVYNANHLLGFLSTFNPDVLRSVELTKGAGSARYGGRLSSVLDVSMKEGDLYERRTRGAVGLVSARVTTEGPIREGRAAYLVSARRTYLDALWGLFQPPDERGGYHFYDLVGKASVVGRRQGLYLSLYGGRDRFWTKYEDEYPGNAGSEVYDGALSWGNLTGALRWYGELSPRLLANTSLGFTSYSLDFDEETHQRSEGQVAREIVGYGSGVTDWIARADFDLRLTPAHLLRFGAHATLHAFRPSVSRVTSRGENADPSSRALGSDDRVLGRAAALYVEDEFSPSRHWGTIVGLRGAVFSAEGATYPALEPRLALWIAPRAGTRLEGSYAQAHQYVHLVSRSGVGVPLDLWLPTTDRVRPQQAWQGAVGASHELTPSLSLSIEAFLKRTRGVIAPIEGSSLLGIDAEGWEDRVEVGRGEAHGVEILVRKREGRLTGWVSYTLARSTLAFDAVDGGRPFPHRYDRRHDVAVTTSYRLTRGWELSGTWVFATGDALWLPAGRAPAVEDFAGYPDDPFYEPDPTAFVYGTRNGTRAPAYHRLDVAARHTRAVGGGTRTWTLGLYNAYGRRNPFFLYPRTADDGRLEYRRMSPFVWVPALSYERSF